MERIKFFIDPAEANYLEVEFEVDEDWSAGAGNQVLIEICGVSLNGEMSLKINDLPKNWKKQILEQIRQEISKWETV